ncbi:MAG: flagellar biosynthesis anti-sigma factor FlgM [Anaerolineaceae bacterium]
MNNTPNSHPAATHPLAFDARTRRVLELRRQIAEGRYAIDHRAVAEALLREQFALDAALGPAAPTPSVTAPTISDFSRFVIAPGLSASTGDENLTATA